MNIKQLVIKHIFALGTLALFTEPAFAIDLYVDNNTQQIYAAPGENRTKLGSFEKKEDVEQLRAKLKAEIEQELKSKPAYQAEGGHTKSIAVAETNSDLPQETSVSEAKPLVKKGNLSAGISYGKNGFEMRTDNDKFSLAIQNRIQARYAEPFDSDPRTLADLERDEKSFMIRRARTKLTGHAYAPWIKYYHTI